MHKPLCIASLLFTLVSQVSAQATLLHEDFDLNLDAWQSEYQWHWEEPGQSACPFTSGESPQGGGAARWGTNCSFDGPLGGSLTLAAPVFIPATANDPRLKFWSHIQTEGCFATYTAWDVHYIQASTDGGATWNTLDTHCAGDGLAVWQEFDLSLMAYRGQDLSLRFMFNAYDAAFNQGFGWVVDDVLVTTGDCSAVTFCAPTANSASPTGAITGFSGTRRIGNNDFALTVDDAPPFRFGHFFYGPDAIQSTVADGTLCVGGGSLGIRRLVPAGMTDAQGHYERHLDFPSTHGSPLAILPGSQWRFQFWFRDLAGGPSGTNFSSGLEVTFCN